MADILLRGQTYRLGAGPATPLDLIASAIAPIVLPKGWSRFRHPDPRCDEPGYQHWYLSSTGLRVCLTAAIEADRKRWLHVSISHRGGRLPTWNEMCQVKTLFCGEERTAYQVHPPASKHVSIHDKCLHLWTCLDGPVTPDFTRSGDTI